jgi:hypothetical protein
MKPGSLGGKWMAEAELALISASAGPYRSEITFRSSRARSVPQTLPARYLSLIPVEMPECKTVSACQRIVARHQGSRMQRFAALHAATLPPCHILHRSPISSSEVSLENPPEPALSFSSRCSKFLWVSPGCRPLEFGAVELTGSMDMDAREINLLRPRYSYREGTAGRSVPM